MAELTVKNVIEDHQVVSSAEWLAARKELLRKEKEFTRQRDQISELRRELPWVKVEKNYVFDSPSGKETLGDLFGNKSQLIVYHFMLGPGWEEGCPSCSFLGDHFEGSLVHLANRDVSFVAVSRAPIAQIEAFKKRMGWRFKWVSSFGNDFNSTTTCRLPKKRSRSTRRITTTRFRISLAKKLREPACFTKTKLEISSTRTQPTGEDWTSW